MSSFKPLNIVLVEPFFSGSHKSWAEGYQHHSQHNISIISLKGIYWKWRMHGGAITLAKMFNNHIEEEGLPDLIIVTDMLNLPVFESFANINNIPIVSFFHENQLTYPWSTQDRDKAKKRDHHYGFINYTTALRSDKVMFNSRFHKDSFINALKTFLKQFPDHNELSNIDVIAEKSVVSYLGLDLQKFNEYKVSNDNEVPIILWNHRWEYDKNPKEFFECLQKIKSQGIPFKLVILGEQFETEMPVFSDARENFSDDIIHMGYCESFKEYATWLWKANILPVTINQDFFGGSIMEAVFCNTYPLLPKRLTYPELFDDTMNKNNFYNDQENFLDKTKQVLINQELSNYSLKKIAQKYDWVNIAPKYDLIMHETCN